MDGRLEGGVEEEVRRQQDYTDNRVKYIALCISPRSPHIIPHISPLNFCLAETRQNEEEEGSVISRITPEFI